MTSDSRTVRKDDLVTLRGSLGKWRVVSIDGETLRLSGNVRHLGDS